MLMAGTPEAIANELDFIWPIYTNCLLDVKYT